MLAWKLLAASAVVMLALVAALAAGCSSGTKYGHVAPKSDPPVLVPWRRVGDIWLGESKQRVEREYGAFRVLQRYGDALQVEYPRLHRGGIVLTFYGTRVGALDVTSPYYRTKRGFGIGSRIPLGPCHRTATDPCERRWHGFIWNLRLREDPCGCWTKVGLGRRSLPATSENFLKPWFIIFVRHGRVSDFVFDLKYVD
jgi:hypothetical protein